MPRDKLPDDLKELLELCRAGKLFQVQEWIAAGKRAAPPEGNFSITPFIAAIRRGFHSLVEVFLRAGVIHQDEKDWGLGEAVSLQRLDLIELLAEHGADPQCVDFGDEVVWTRVPKIISWFIRHGADLETGYPIARAFRCRNRQFLGIYMGLRDKVPSARKQAAMALRYHCDKGNMKWVSLLLWAGADARMAVLDIEDPACITSEEDPDDSRSALEQAVWSGQTEVVKKIGLKPGIDDCSALLAQATLFCRPEIFRVLLEAGADPNRGKNSRNTMRSLITSLAWHMNPPFGRSETGEILTCLELAAGRGGRWKADDFTMRSLRRAISKTHKASDYEAIYVLRRLARSGALERDTFLELVRTPSMRELLQSPTVGGAELRKLAGCTIRAPKRKGMRRR
jgi:hypothetical protein